MKHEVTGKMLTVYIGDEDRWKTGLLYPALVDALKASGVAGVTVLRGLEGYGINGKLHTARLEVFFQGLPVLIQAVDTADQISKAVSIVEAMVVEGLITIQDVDAIRLTRDLKP